MSDNFDFNSGFNSDITSDDKLWALLAYVFSPLVPVLILLMEDKKNRPFLKKHTMQALVLGIINVVVAVVLGWLIFTICINIGLWVYSIYLGYSAYQGQEVSIPVITDLVKNQGWA